MDGPCGEGPPATKAGSPGAAPGQKGPLHPGNAGPIANRGHSMSDPAKYRTREEVDKVRHDQDPIEQVSQPALGGEDERTGIEGDRRRGAGKSSMPAADFRTQHDAEPDGPLNCGPTSIARKRGARAPAGRAGRNTQDRSLKFKRVNFRS